MCVLQTRPVPFTVHAVVTNSDLEFDHTNIDFGCCTIYEAVKQTVTLTNHSILPQQFGFVGIPDVGSCANVIILFSSKILEH